MYGFLLLRYSNFVHKTHHFWDNRLQKCCDPENRVRGPWRSLEMSPVDRVHMTSYWRSIVTMALSRVVWDIQCRKISRPWNRSQLSFKVTESGTIRWIGYGILLVFFYSNFVPKIFIVPEIFNFKNALTLKTGLSRSLEMSLTIR